MKQYFSHLEVYEEMTNYENKTLGEIDLYSTEVSRKSYVGHLIEKSIFEFEPNSKSFPDLDYLELEIKSTPVKKVKNNYVSKERLVLNIINYCTENWYNFEESSFWKKNKNLLIVFYEYFINHPKTDYKILKSIIYQFPEEDFKVILNDWLIIAQKVIDGKAHEISERDTLYLSACTKGKNHESMREQPFSEIPAKQRAYSFKPSYMTTVFNDYVINQKDNEKIINKLKFETGNFNLQDSIVEMFKPFLGKSSRELVKILNLETSENAKSINSLIINKIMGLQTDYKKIDEFKKAGIIPKTVRVESNGKIKESMSFPTFKFTEIIEEIWEESKIYNIITNSQFLFIIFQSIKGTEDYTLDRIKFWSMSDEDIEECRVVYEKTKEIIKNGVILIEENNKIKNNLPSKEENKVMHVRPHAQDREDAYELPDGRLLTKQCFWLNREYLMNIINNNGNENG